MIEIKFAKMLEYIIESFLPTFTNNIALTFGISLLWESFEVGKEGRFQKKLLLVAYRPSNYTKILLYELDNKETFFHLLVKNNKIDFRLESDHDSCWRSDGFTFLNKVQNEAEKYFLKNYKLDIRDKGHVSSFHTFDLFGGKPKFFNIDIEKVKDDNYIKTGMSRSYKITFKNEMKISYIEK
jgi:hypothetical protein